MGYLVTASYFDLLGPVPAVGAFFQRDDEPSVVLGHDIWRRQYGGDPSVVGRTIYIDSRPFSVVGVAPAGFHGTTHGLRADLWIPVAAYDFDTGGGFDWLTVFGRTRPGVEQEVAAAAVDAVARTTPGVRATVRGAELVPLTGVPPDVRARMVGFLSLLVMTGVVVLIIASANVAGTLMTRAMSRRREVAIRRALGASRNRITRLFLTETFLLFAVCGLLGLPLGAIAVLYLETLSLPVGFDVAFDFASEPSVLVGGLGLAGITGLVFGLVPAVQAAGQPVAPSLKQTARGRSRHARGWRLFVGAQIALSVLLLVNAGVFARSVWHAQDLDLGFDHEDVVVGQVYLGPHGYTEDRGRSLHRTMLEHMLAVPGVEAAGWADGVLLGSSYGRYATSVRSGSGASSEEASTTTGVSYVDPGYLETLRIRPRAGRGFTGADRDGTPWVAVINETLADELWPGETSGWPPPAERRPRLRDRGGNRPREVLHRERAREPVHVPGLRSALPATDDVARSFFASAERDARACTADPHGRSTRTSRSGDLNDSRQPYPLPCSRNSSRPP